MCTANITISVPEDLKRCMQRLKHINWSEVARRAFEEMVSREEMRVAADTIKRLRMESQTQWDGAKEIRRWRDAAR
jgi:predicted alpha/beta-fold hydrolase